VFVSFPNILYFFQESLRAVRVVSVIAMVNICILWNKLGIVLFVNPILFPFGGVVTEEYAVL